MKCGCELALFSASWARWLKSRSWLVWFVGWLCSTFVCICMCVCVGLVCVLVCCKCVFARNYDLAFVLARLRSPIVVSSLVVGLSLIVNKKVFSSNKYVLICSSTERWHWRGDMQKRRIIVLVRENARQEALSPSLRVSSVLFCSVLLSSAICCLLVCLCVKATVSLAPFLSLSLCAVRAITRTRMRERAS